jgi:hypothetical protein
VDITESDQIRFWRFVNRSRDEECWEWKGCKNNRGYGRFHLGKAGQAETAHRVAFTICNPAISITGKVVCHRCDNRPCVNPKHLFVGTHADNTADMVAKRRHAFGEGNGRRKLSAAQVVEIRGLVRAGVPVVEIAEQFGIDLSHTYSIVRGRFWKEALCA